MRCTSSSNTLFNQGVKLYEQQQWAAAATVFQNNVDWLRQMSYRPGEAKGLKVISEN